MNINTLKAYEHNSSTSEILSAYLICKPELIIQKVVVHILKLMMIMVLRSLQLPQKWKLIEILEIGTK